MVLPIVTAFAATGEGKPRSSPAHKIPATAFNTPRIPSEAITGIVVRIDWLFKSCEFFREVSGRIKPRSTIAPRIAPLTSAITNALQYE